MPGIVDMLAFGRVMQPDGLCDIDALAARIVAARELFRAALRGKIEIYGQRYERLSLPVLGPPMLRKISPFARIDPQEFVGDRLTLCPLNWEWLALSSVAADPELWQGAESVRYADLVVDRESLGAWLGEFSGNAVKKRGRRPEYPWGEIKTEAIRLMDYRGDFTADDPGWKQARLEKKLFDFCTKKIQREPSETQLRTQIKLWLEEWRRNKTKVGN